MTTDTARSYWQSRTEYPFPFTRRRRIHELNYLVPRLARTGGKSLLDLGCGDGSLLECLLRLTDFEQFYGYDVAENLLRDIDPKISTAVYDIARPGPLPQVDAAIVAGVIQYVFDDDMVGALFERITAPVVWVRSTCSLGANAERVVRDGYASNYRTVPETYALLSRHHQVTAVDRIYPDDIESAFGTKQFYFEVRRKS